MGNLNFSLGKVQYDNLSLSIFPLEAQIGVGVGATIVVLIVLIIVLIYRSVGVVTQARQLFFPIQPVGGSRGFYQEPESPLTPLFLCTLA